MLTWTLETGVFAGITAVSLTLLLLSLLFDDFLNFGDGHEGIMPYVNGTSILAGITAFGALGWILTVYTHLDMRGVIGIAGGIMIVFIVLASLIYKRLVKTTTTTAYSINDLVGKTGLVKTRIVKSKVGEVEINIPDRGPEYFSALSDEDIQVNTEVKIMEIIGGALKVAPIKSV